MNPANGKSLLVVVRRPPYSDSLARAALDAALAAAAFDQPVDLLFLGDGVLQLLPQQDPAAVGRKSVARLLASLPLYGIEQVSVDATAVARYRFDPVDSPVPAVTLDTAAIRALLQQHDNLLGF